PMGVMEKTRALLPPDPDASTIIPMRPDEHQGLGEHLLAQPSHHGVTIRGAEPVPYRRMREGARRPRHEVRRQRDRCRPPIDAEVLRLEESGEVAGQIPDREAISELVAGVSRAPGCCQGLVERALMVRAPDPQLHRLELPPLVCHLPAPPYHPAHAAL